MEIVIAKNAGFCFGVKRAIDSTYDFLNNAGLEIYSIGPLIHNESVINDLTSKGLIVINNYEEINKIKNKKVIIRTHGIEKEAYDILKANGNEIIDLTCPFVSKIHRLVEEYSKKGYKIIVIGDKNHQEVKGIVSYATGEIYVVISEDDIKTLKIGRNDRVFVVFQTTTNALNAQKLVDILKDLFYNINLVNTICNATQDRQSEIENMSKNCDVMLIIGSSTSSNTRKLYDISKVNCSNTFFVESIEDTKNIKIKESFKVGVGAGASTPKYLIEEILNHVRNEF